MFSMSMALGNVDEIEEERRVLYVALTRAKNELIITRNINSVHGGTQSIEIHEKTDDIEQPELIQDKYFLNGIPDDLTEQLTIERPRREVKDIDKPNSLDLSSGMDFS